MSMKEFKKEVADMLSKYNKGLKETNITGIIADDVDEIAKKHNYYVDDTFSASYIGYNENQRNKIDVYSQDDDRLVGTLNLSVYRNEYGTYEYNCYFSQPLRKTLKP